MSKTITHQTTGLKIEIPNWRLAIDKREQNPWTFERLIVGTGKSRKIVALITEPATLKTGDYSIVGMESQAAIERKSKDDIYSTLGNKSRRERFTLELSRLNAMRFSAVIIEDEWEECMNYPPLRSKLKPVSFDGMINAYMVRFPMVHWVFRPGRYIASKVCFKLLDRYYKDNAGQ